MLSLFFRQIRPKLKQMFLSVRPEFGLQLGRIHFDAVKQRRLVKIVDETFKSFT